jgi:hypothetical protein
MTNNKSTMETYRIFRNGEWATIAIQGWVKGSQQLGELLIHSSFGSWGYRWVNIGQPIKRMLISAGFDALMGKLMAGKLREFDFQASEQAWLRHVEAACQAGTLTLQQAAEVRDLSAMPEHCSLDMFLRNLEDSQPADAGLHNHPLWEDLAAYVICRNNVQAESFWRELWQPFVLQLRNELAGPANDDDGSAEPEGSIQVAA